MGYKVGIVCYPTYGGSGAVASELALALTRRGHTVHIFSFALPFRLQMRDLSPVSFHKVEAPEYPLFKSYPPYLLSLVAKIAEISQAAKLDIIHVHYAVPFTLAATLAVEMLDNPRPRVLTTLHGTDVTLVGQDPSFYDVVRFSIEKSHGLTAVSDYLVRETQSIFHPSKPVQRIYNFVDTRRFRREKSVPFLKSIRKEGYKILIHVSNFRLVKRVCDTIQVFANVREKVKCRLVLIGEGPEYPLAKRMAAELKLDSQVHFLGFQMEVESFLSGADVLLMPSEEESFCVAALEALSCGVPVIATNVGGLPEVVAHGECGFLTTIKNISEQTAFTLELLRNESLWMKMSENARARAVSLFDVSKIIPQYEKAYHSLLNHHPED